MQKVFDTRITGECTLAINKSGAFFLNKKTHVKFFEGIF